MEYKNNETKDNVVSIKSYKKSKIKKWKIYSLIGAGIIVVGIGAGIVADKALYTEIEIQTFPNDTYEEILDTYSIGESQIKGFTVKYKDGNTLDLTAKVKKSDEETIERIELLNDQRKREYEEAQELYSFNYRVAPGDTISGLAEKFETDIRNVNSGKALIVSGETITIKVHNQSQALLMENLYNENIESLEFDYYYQIKDGDNIMTISDKTNVPANLILNFNGMSTSDTLYAGSYLKIPKYNIDKSNGMSRKY